MTGFMTSPRNSPGTVAVLDRAPTSTTFSRVLGIATLVGIGWMVVFGLFLSPNDRVQKTGVRIMYIHVPSAWLAYLAFGVTGVSSLAYLWKRTRSLAWDRVAGASAEVGVLFMGITLVSGSLWGGISWGTYGTWDARLTTTAFLFVTAPVSAHMMAKAALSLHMAERPPQPGAEDV